MIADNTILLGIIAILNGFYLVGQRNQRGDLKDLVNQMKLLSDDFLIVKTEHRDRYPCEIEEPAKKILVKKRKIRFARSATMILLFIFLCGCSVSKHVNSEKLVTNSNVTEKGVLNVDQKKEKVNDIHSNIDDHITENCDSNYSVPGQTTSASKSVKDLLGGDPLIRESGNITGEVRYDSVTGKVFLTVIEKPHQLPTKFLRTIDHHEQLTDQSKEDDHALTNSTSNKNEKDSSTDQVKEKQVDTSYLGWIPVVLGLAAIVGVVVFVFFKFIKPRIL